MARSGSTAAAADQLMTWYATRWSTEVAFRDAKQHLGIERLYGWSERAARPMASTPMLVSGLVVPWSATRRDRRVATATAQTFGSMPAAPREATARSAILDDPAAGPVAEKPAELLLGLLRLAEWTAKVEHR